MVAGDEFAEIFAAEERFAFGGAFAGQELNADARAVVRGCRDELPAVRAVEPGFVEVAALSVGRAHEPEGSV